MRRTAYNGLEGGETALLNSRRDGKIESYWSRSRGRIWALG